MFGTFFAFTRMIMPAWNSRQLFMPCRITGLLLSPDMTNNRNFSRHRGFARRRCKLSHGMWPMVDPRTRTRQSFGRWPVTTKIRCCSPNSIFDQCKANYKSPCVAVTPSKCDGTQDADKCRDPTLSNLIVRKWTINSVGRFDINSYL